MTPAAKPNAQRLSEGLSWLAVAAHASGWPELRANDEAEVKQALRDGLDAVAQLRRLLASPGLDDGIHAAAREIVAALGLVAPGAD